MPVTLRRFITSHSVASWLIAATVFFVGAAANLWTFLRDVVPGVFGALADVVRPVTQELRLSDLGVIWPVVSWVMTVIGAVFLILIWRVLKTDSAPPFRVDGHGYVETPEEVIARLSARVRELEAEPPGPTPIAKPETISAVLDRPRSSSERVYVQVTAAYLVNLYKTHTSMEADRLMTDAKGKWIRVRGLVSDVLTFGDHHRYIQMNEPGQDHLFGLTFRGIAADAVVGYQRGDEISVDGQIEEANSGKVALDNCELLAP